MDACQIRNILEACLLVAGKPMNIARLESLFADDIDRPDRGEIREALLALQQAYEGRGIELVEVASGWRLQSRASVEHWVSRLFEEKAPRYSRALLETLVLIAYRQPVTRGDIEDVRGVAVSSNIIRTLVERGWIREVGHKEVPGKPALFGTTREFLDYFNLKRLEDLPPLGGVMDLEALDAVLAADVGPVEGVGDHQAANDEAPETTTADSPQTEPAADSGDGESAESAPAATFDPALDKRVADVETVDDSAPGTTHPAPGDSDAGVASGASEDQTGEQTEDDGEAAVEVGMTAAARLRQVVDRFAGEHRQEISARDQFEARVFGRGAAAGGDSGPGGASGQDQDGEAPESDTEDLREVPARERADGIP